MGSTDVPAGNPMDVLSASASQGLRWHQPFCAVRFLWHPAHQGGANPAFSPLWPPARRFRERGPNKRGQLPVRPRAVGWVGEGSASLRAHPPRANRHRRTPLFAEPTTPAGPQKPLGEAFAQRGQRAGGRARSAAQRSAVCRVRIAHVGLCQTPNLARCPRVHPGGQIIYFF